MITITRFFRSVVRFFIVWFLETISLLITAWLVPGISIQPVELASKLVVAIASTLMLGIVNLLTDGLSYQRIQKAIDDGYMPTLKQMMEEDGYKLSRVDCGVPPTTPACQAEILQGNNTNIPAFRWLDKKTGLTLENLLINFGLTP